MKEPRLSLSTAEAIRRIFDETPTAHLEEYHYKGKHLRKPQG
jgi:hypothetical protein